MTANEMHRAYSRETVKRLRAAAREFGATLSVGDIEAFQRGCRTDGGWTARGFKKALVLRLANAGLVTNPAGLSLFGMRLTEAWLTPAGRGLWWRIEEVYADTMPLLRAALRQRVAERAAAAPKVTP